MDIDPGQIVVNIFITNLKEGMNRVVMLAHDLKIKGAGNILVEGVGIQNVLDKLDQWEKKNMHFRKDKCTIIKLRKKKKKH